MKKLSSFFTPKNLLLSLGIWAAGSLVGPVLKEIMLELDEEDKKIQQLDEKKQQMFITNKDNL